MQAEALRQAGQVVVFEIDPCAGRCLRDMPADENVDAVYYYSDQARSRNGGSEGDMQITIALAKGRLAEMAEDLLAGAGWM